MAMKITRNALKELVEKELSKKVLNEKRRAPDREKGIPNDISDKTKTLVAHALDILENAVDGLENSDAEETRWYLTKVGEAFGMEPEDDEED